VVVVGVVVVGDEVAEGLAGGLVGEADVVLGAGVSDGSGATEVCGLPTGVPPELGVVEEQAAVSARAPASTTTTSRMPLTWAILITAPCDGWSSHQE
jgi:hypothetical protein